MDVLKLKLSTKWMRGIVAKLISKAIKAKLGCDVEVLINEIAIENKDGKIHLHADVEANMENNDFIKVIKTIGLD